MKRPPKFAEWLISLIVHREEREFILGDLKEVYQEKHGSFGYFRAWIWYWGQLIKSFHQFQRATLNWRLTMFNNYLTVAFRNIKKYKGYSFINITGLALGMACCILIMLWVQDELNYDSFHKQADDLYRITISSKQGIWVSSPWALVPALKKDFPEIIKGSRYLSRDFTVKYQDSIYTETCALVDPDFFEMFTFPLVKGDPQTVFSDLNAAVITARTALKYFGNENPLGKVINFENRVDLKVTGVIEDLPSASHMQFDILTRPVHLVGKARMLTWSMDCPSYVLLPTGANAAEVQKKISAVIINQDKRTSTKYYVNLQPLKRIRLYALNGVDPVIYVYIFSTIAFIVLLIACINFMNLSTASAAIRIKEIGTRKVFGAAKWDLIKQFLGESMVLAFLAMLVAMVFIISLLPAFNNLAAKNLTFSGLANIPFFLKILGIALATGFVSGSYPAFYFSSFSPANVLKDGSGSGSRTNVLRKVLTVTQFASAIILMISTTVIYKQIHFIKTKDLGFKRDQILSFRTSRELRPKMDALKKQLLLNNKIINVTGASSIPLRIGNTNPVYWEGGSSEQYVPMNFVCVDYDYFETFEMKMAYGRSFSRNYPTDKKNYIINEAALKLTGYKDPIGKMFSMWTAKGQIVGVVKDFHGTSLHNDIRPIVFVLYKNLPYTYMYVKLSPEAIQSTVSFIKDKVQEFSPGIPFNYNFLDDLFYRQYLREGRIAKILKYFSALAILISCLGLFGLAAFMASRRAKEVAIRKVLGAPLKAILGILSKEFLLLVAIANIIAWPPALYFMKKWIQNFAFHTNIGWYVFVYTGLVTVVIALATVSYQTFKAALANPVDRLRNE